jgi:heptosyltransferase II
MSYKNILVHSMMNIGDVLLTTSAAALLKKVQPEARVTMMVREAAREIVENNPAIDAVIVFKYKNKQKSWRAMWAIVQEIKSHHFDLCISFDQKLRPAIITFLAGIPTRVLPDSVFEDGPDWGLKLMYTNVLPLHHNIVHSLQAEAYQSIIRAFFHTEDHARPVMALPAADSEARIGKLLAALPHAKQRIGLCIKGTFPLKTWPKEYFIQVVKKLSTQYDAAFFIIGAPGDSGYAEEMIHECPEVRIVDFCGKTRLVDLVPLFQQTDLFVTVDTGSAHIAATADVPMVVMYGCTTPDRWFPMSDSARVLTTREECCPCSAHPEDCPRAKCLWNITPAMVLAQCNALLR